MFLRSSGSPASRVSPLRSILVLGAVLAVFHLFGQQDSLGTYPHQFGFFLSADRCLTNPRLRSSEEIPPAYRDSISAVNGVPATGFSLGMLYERPILAGFSVRALPSLNFMSGTLEYRYSNGMMERISFERMEVGLTIQPLVFAQHSPGPYMAVGPSVGYDLEDNPAFRRLMVRLDSSFGVRTRLSGFHIGAEVRFAKSFSDLLVERESLHALVIQELQLDTFSFRIVVQD